MNILKRRAIYLYGQGLGRRVYGPLLFCCLIAAIIWSTYSTPQVHAETSSTSEYESTWESLDSRATPDWFQDAK
ncbi:MAG: alpha-L-fucosidase, partial [Pirellulales bacterium]|nr:alpha-L-fucosidase [Pirellulales bacterium]